MWTKLQTWLSKYPSWAIEAVAGLILASVAQISGSWYIQAYIATSLSWIYETSFDANLGQPYHKPWNDLAERQVGVVLGLLAWNLLV